MKQSHDLQGVPRTGTSGKAEEWWQAKPCKVQGGQAARFVLWRSGRNREEETEREVTDEISSEQGSVN